MLKKKFSKNKFVDPIENPYVKFSIDGEELAKVTIKFAADVDPKHFGMMLSMVNKGLAENNIEDVVISHGEEIGETELSMEILSEMENASNDIDEVMAENLGVGVNDMINKYPIIPAWSNPEMTSLFDETVQDKLPKKLTWEYLDTSDKLDDDEPEESDNDSRPSAYAIQGGGFLTESQFKRLQKSQEEDSDDQSPDYEMRYGFSNFTITLPRFKSIANSCGVEYAKVLGRYSFVIAIGKMFEFGDVRREIEDKLEIIRPDR